jgi:pantoate--beta-alanine ligase
MSSTFSKATSRLAIHRTLDAMRSARQSLGVGSNGGSSSSSSSATTIGFVPTMGALHDGHASLVKEARRNNDVVICSIFVNPTQFAPTDDLDKYPRQLEQDVALLEELGVDHLFAPSDPTVLYGPHHVTYVDPHGFDDIAEGRARPGHFRGVATIVTKLFNIVQPTHAYFGQKDAAQCSLIQRVVEDLNIPVHIVIRDTIRDADGLAMSSRNAYLTPTEREAAPVVYRALCAARDWWESNSKSCTAQELQQLVRAVLQDEVLVTDVQYVTVDHCATMRPLETVGSDGAIISLATKIGSVRLIDNIVLK